jgi:RNA polymerase sigma-70 factor (ECF subfamily)
VLKPGDLALAAAVLRKDRKATAEFVARFTDPVFRYLQSRLMPRIDLAEDLAHEVFITAWQGLESYSGAASLESWLIGIARHKVQDHYRAILRAHSGFDELDREPEDSTTQELDLSIDRGRAGERIRAILEQMPDAYRAVILWRYWEGVSTRDISERIGRTEKGAERLLARARQDFKRKWNDAGTQNT